MHPDFPRQFAAALLPAWLWLVIATALIGRADAMGLERLPNANSGPSFGAGDFETLPPSVTADELPPARDPILPDTSDWPAESGDFCDGNHPSAGLPWCWQWLPSGLVWRSYLAGVKEPRFAWLMSDDSRFDTIWDTTLGGRVALLRYGTPNAYRPNGWEIQFEAAALPRLWPTKPSWPLVSCDYRVGVPLVYAYGPWQFKTGYYHISAHLGDEFMLLNPGWPRINYIRDSWMLALGYYYTEDLRLCAEVDYAFEYDGGARPWEFQFGADYSPAERGGAPFAAAYANLRQELDFGGFVVFQLGWQVRGGPAMHTFRVGVEYVNGASTQYEFFNLFEQRVGFGIWYDY
ncbi:MAG: DUF1207 domain-containing protein [Pirellulales bacterium]